jgi:hypothetical protein
MAFKVKTKNRNPINTKQTLDATHHEIIDQFQQEIAQIPQIEEQITILENSIASINANIRAHNDDPIYCMKLQEQIWKLDDERSELLHKIQQIKSCDEESKYLLRTGGILQKYYKLIETEGDEADHTPISSIIQQQQQQPKNNKSIKSKLDKKSVLDWFTSDGSEGQIIQTNNNDNNNDNNNEHNIHKENIENIEDEDDDNNDYDDNNNNDDDDDNNDELTSQTINKNDDFIAETESKGKLYNQYMSVIQKDYIVENNAEDTLDICELCNSEMLLNQNMGTLICSSCGVQDFILIDSDKPSYKDPPKEMTSFCYKRINHLNEFLAQFQAKETTDIDEDIYNEILVEINKERINNMADLTPEKLRIILRKIKRNDYYEHIPYIINQLNGLPPPVISPEVEEIIRNMFKEVQIPFDLYCPQKRKNFLSYNFVMYKFFELLELDEYLKSFQLLKSRTKLYQQDIIWKNICTYLSWEFIPSL